MQTYSVSRYLGKIWVVLKKIVIVFLLRFGYQSGEVFQIQRILSIL